MEKNLKLEDVPGAIYQLFEISNRIESLLLNLDISSQSDQLLSIQETAKLIRLSVATIYTKVSREEIPVSKMNGRLYFSKQEILEWIKKGKRKTMEENLEAAHTFLKPKRK